MAFSLGLHLGIRDGKASRIGSALVALSGAAFVMEGIFPCDSGYSELSRSGVAHGVFARISESAIIIAPLAMSFGLKRDERWHAYVFYCLATAVAATVLYVLYQLGLLASWKGIAQRILIAMPLIWIEVMAIRLLRLS